MYKIGNIKKAETN